MKSFRKELEFETRKREEVINITEQCEAALKESRIKEGLALIFPLHTSSAVFISDSDPGISEDWMDLANQLVPENPNYRHNFADPEKKRGRTSARHPHRPPHHLPGQRGQI